MDRQIAPLLTELTTAHIDFLQVAGQFKPEQWDQSGVCGSWSPKEVAAHLIGWDQALKEFITAPDMFEPPAGVDAFNDQSVAARKDMSWQAVLAEMKTNFQELKLAVAAVVPEMKSYARVVSWLPGRTADYILHTGQLAAWLA